VTLANFGCVGGIGGMNGGGNKKFSSQNWESRCVETYIQVFLKIILVVLQSSQEPAWAEARGQASRTNANAINTKGVVEAMVTRSNEW
jgi:hypothetical protein